MDKEEGSKLLTNFTEKENDISAFNDSEYKRGEHPNSLKNLKPFPKGISGNPLGRPNKYEKIAKALSLIGSEKRSTYTNKNRRDLVLETIWDKAEEGNMQFIQLLAWLGCLDPKD